jgi:hypothetical protein
MYRQRPAAQALLLQHYLQCSNVNSTSNNSSSGSLITSSFCFVKTKNQSHMTFERPHIQSSGALRLSSQHSSTDTGVPPHGCLLPKAGPGSARMRAASCTPSDSHFRGKRELGHVVVHCGLSSTQSNPVSTVTANMVAFCCRSEMLTRQTHKGLTACPCQCHYTSRPLMKH